MPLTVEWVRYGRPAADTLRATIARTKADDPLSQVTVVVPSNQVGVAARRLLASGELGPTARNGSGIVAVAFLTVYRLAELLGAAHLAGQGRRPVSTPVIGAGLRTALRSDPGIFAPVAEHPATEMALIGAHKELRDLPTVALQRIGFQSERAGDVVRLHRATRALLLDASFSDEEDLIASAIDVLTAGRAPLRELGALVVYLPQRLSRHAAALLAQLADRTELRVIAGTTGDPKADAEVVGSIRRIDPDGSGDGQSDPASVPADPMAVVAPARTRVVTTSDADEEVRVAVRAVIDAVRAGSPLERVAILYGAHDPYARLVHEQLSAAGIPHNGSSVIPLTARMAGRTLLGLLMLPSSGFRRADLFAWLAGGQVRNEGRPVPVAAWERLSRDAGVVAGRDEWDRLLDTYAADYEAEAERSQAHPDSPEWMSARLRQDAERVRALRSFVLGLIDDAAEAIAEPRGWADHAAWGRRHLHKLLGGERQRWRWPLVERKAAERTERALDRLAGLEAVEGPVSLDVFRRTLTLELETDLGRVGRMGEGALVGSVRMGVGLDLDLVIVLGLAEGSFPKPLSDDALLPDREREAARGELPLRADETERQHRELFATLAGADRHVLCVPRGDLRRSSERVPSRWVIEIASSLSGQPMVGDDLAVASGSWLEHVPSFDAGLRRVAFPATEQEHRLRALLADDRASSTLRPADDDLADPIVAAGAQMVLACRGPLFTRFDGNLSGMGIASPASAVTSATRLKGWAVCPYAYFVREILRVEPVENPEDRLQISPLDLGFLVHEVLERFIDDVLTRPVSEQPAPQDSWTGADRRLLLDIADSVCDRYEEHGLVGRPIFWQRDRRRIVADLLRFLQVDSSHRATYGTRPVAAELAFGMRSGALGTVELPIPDGRSVRFRGKADRLDVAADGTLEVVDYKTGRRDRYAGLSEEDPDLRGTKLQLVVYALAARLHQGLHEAPARSEYWFTSAKGEFKRIGYMVTPDVLNRVGATVGQMVRGIEEGVFPPHPTAASTTPFVECPYCDPDGLGVVDLRRQIERKRPDPELAVFFDLAEGQAVGTVREDELEQVEMVEVSGG